MVRYPAREAAGGQGRRASSESLIQRLRSSAKGIFFGAARPHQTIRSRIGGRATGTSLTAAADFAPKSALLKKP